jgi:hypothetical protein
MSTRNISAPILKRCVVKFNGTTLLNFGKIYFSMTLVFLLRVNCKKKPRDCMVNSDECTYENLWKVSRHLD